MQPLGKQRLHLCKRGILPEFMVITNSASQLNIFSIHQDSMFVQYFLQKTLMNGVHRVTVHRIAFTAS